MSKQRTILIDDEANSLELLEYELKPFTNIKIIAKCSDARKAVALIENEKPDLVFLDIEMPWLSGFEVLDKLSYLDFNLIFVTAYDEYAIKAFKYLAFDYLLKPIDKNKLDNSLKRIQSKLKKQQATDLKRIVSLVKQGEFRLEKIAFPTQKGIEFYSIDEIIHCKADSNYSEIYIVDGKKILVSKTLKKVEKIINNTRFLRVHQSHLINLDYLISYIKEDGGYLKMSDKSIVPISRSRKVEFLERINNEYK